VSAWRIIAIVVPSIAAACASPRTEPTHPPSDLIVASATPTATASASAAPISTTPPLPRDRVSAAFFLPIGIALETDFVTDADPLDRVAPCFSSDPGAGWALFTFNVKDGRVESAYMAASAPRQGAFGDCVVKALVGARFYETAPRGATWYLSVAAAR
jgi:hypothetical protein